MIDHGPTSDINIRSGQSEFGGFFPPSLTDSTTRRLESISAQRSKIQRFFLRRRTPDGLLLLPLLFSEINTRPVEAALDIALLVEFVLFYSFLPGVRRKVFWRQCKDSVAFQDVEFISGSFEKKKKAECDFWPLLRGATAKSVYLLDLWIKAALTFSFSFFFWQNCRQTMRRRSCLFIRLFIFPTWLFFPTASPKMMRGCKTNERGSEVSPGKRGETSFIGWEAH